MTAEDDRPAEPYGLFSEKLEALALGGSDDLREQALGDVHPRFDEKQEPAWLQGGQDFGEKPPQVGHLVGHPEGQREIGLQVETQPVFTAEVKADTAGDTGPLRSFPCLFEHARMDVHGHDQAFLSDPPGHGDGEEPGPAAGVDGDIPLLEEPGEDPARVVGHPPENVRQ